MPPPADAAMDRLSEFLSEQLRAGMVWGVSDCLMLPADWLVRLGWFDPAAPWRGSYRDEAGADAILNAAGGVEGLMREALEPLGLEPLASDGATHAVRGDIGAVVVRGLKGRTVAGGICTGDRWAVRAGRGLLIARAEVVSGWRVIDREE